MASNCSSHEHSVPWFLPRATRAWLALDLTSFVARALRAAALALALVLGWLGTGCSSPWQTAALVSGGAAVVGGYSPNNEIEQVYYLGVFDPQDQVPPSVYRVRVRGQASFLSRKRFASGWVRADLIDSLGTNATVNELSGSIQFTRADGDPLASLQTGRRLMLFGPEGFREAPKDHRLVVVMGSNPDTFFRSMDQTLGVVSKAQSDLRESTLQRHLFEAMIQVENERKRLDDLAADLTAELSPSTAP
jgi:hypothetical protein